MSTRCQIVILEPTENIIREAESEKNVKIYVHSDGYPRGEHGILARILPLVRDFEKERGHDIEYLTAQLVHSLVAKKRATYPDYLGFGVGTQMHGDIEFLYIILPEEIQVYKVECNGESTSYGLLFSTRIVSRPKEAVLEDAKNLLPKLKTPGHKKLMKELIAIVEEESKEEGE